MAAKYTALEFSSALRASIRVPSQIATPLAKAIAKDIQLNFDLGQDPYEKAWRPLAAATLRKGRTPPPLTDTRKGRKSIRVKPNKDAGIVIVVNDAKMKFHQVGAKPRLPRRSFLPTNTLPKTWKLYWDAELAKGYRKRLEKK